MRLLPSEKDSRAAEAIVKYQKTGRLAIYEPCNCGSHIRHNNGGNYHDEIYLRHDSGKDFVKFETTCELEPPAEWQECEDVESVVREYADWL